MLDITARMSMARAATLRGRIDRPALETETAQMMDGPTWMPPLNEAQLNALARLIERWHRRVMETGDDTTQEMLDELREVCFGTVPHAWDERTKCGKPTPQDIWSARLLVLMCDQDGEEVEPAILELAAQNVGPTGPWERKPVARRQGGIWHRLIGGVVLRNRTTGAAEAQQTPGGAEKSQELTTTDDR